MLPEELPTHCASRQVVAWIALKTLPDLELELFGRRIFLSDLLSISRIHIHEFFTLPMTGWHKSL